MRVTVTTTTATTTTAKTTNNNNNDNNNDNNNNNNNNNNSHTFFAALVFGALRALAHGGVVVVYQGVALRAVVVGADLLAALGLLALAVVAPHVLGVVDQSVTVRAVARAAVLVLHEC